jgi:predicted nucleic acid-binding protein
MAKNIIADTGYWFALFDPSDEYYEEATTLEVDLRVHQLVVPWPTLYETLNTRLLRRRHSLSSFKATLDRPGTVLVEDGPYRDASLRSVLDMNKSHTYSLVDQVIRSMITDAPMRIDALITFNPRDFRDVCASRGVELLY